MLLLTITEFMGRFHPVVVHLPIGILLLGVLFLVLMPRDKYAALGAALPLVFLLGALSAAAACLTGWLLAANGDYDPAVVGRHRWLGVALAALSLGGYFLIRRGAADKWRMPLALSLGGLLFLTGHLGGTITHGEGYLTQPLAAWWGDSTATAAAKVIPDVQEALVYEDLVGPVLEAKCYSCHSARKQKGRLRLDTPDGIRKGGKNGAAITPGQTEKSELYRRLRLDPLEKEHMPPKGKPQLTEAEITLLHWWIEAGADFERRVKDLAPPEAMNATLASFETPDSSTQRKPDIPATETNPPAAADLEALRRAGVVVMPVAAGSNYLAANFINVPQAGDAELALLQPLADQLVWLKLGQTRLTDEGLSLIGRLPQLTRLSLDNTAVTDAGLTHLKDLNNLQYLNLVGTAVTEAGLLELKDLSDLRAVYLYRSKVNREAWPQLTEAFPGVEIDSGGYTLALPESGPETGSEN